MGMSKKELVFTAALGALTPGAANADIGALLDGLNSGKNAVLGKIATLDRHVGVSASGALPNGSDGQQMLLLDVKGELLPFSLDGVPLLPDGIKFGGYFGQRSSGYDNSSGQYGFVALSPRLFDGPVRAYLYLGKGDGTEVNGGVAGDLPGWIDPVLGYTSTSGDDPNTIYVGFRAGPWTNESEGEMPTRSSKPD